MTQDERWFNQYASTSPHCDMRLFEYLWPKTKKLVKEAIENAKLIRDLGKRIPGGLSTDVYKLVEKLIK